MNGEGTGGGGAVALLLGLWLVALFIVLDPLGGDDVVPGASEAPSPSATVQPTPSPTPDLSFGIACETDEECAEPITRAELAGALDRALDLEPTTRNPFTDDDDSEFEPAINRLAAAGLLGGCTETTFCPETTATRAQVATVLVRAYGFPASDVDAFDDDDGSIHESAIDAVAAAGVTGGCGERAFCPDREISREALRTLLERIVTESYVTPPASAAPSASP